MVKNPFESCSTSSACQCHEEKKPVGRSSYYNRSQSINNNFNRHYNYRSHSKLFGACSLLSWCFLCALLLPTASCALSFSTDDLQNNRFPFTTSNDKFLDICKSKLYDGDIVMTSEDMEQVARRYSATSNNDARQSGADAAQRRQAGDEEAKRRRKRAATGRAERIWEHGVIPYEIGENFTGTHRALFRQAMMHWENYTCISFVERRPDDVNYIVFTTADCGCCSYVGKRGDGPQAISLGKNCDKLGIIVHELGHVIGFWHEHTRPDREQYVDIFYKNIQPGQEYNFEVLTGEDVNSMGESYDYASIMHYARDTFSKALHLDTILPKSEVNGGERPEIGQRVRLSPGDIVQAKKLYKCPKCGRTLLDSRAAIRYPEPMDMFEGFSSLASFTTASHPYVAHPIHCHWRVIAAHGEHIILNITRLDLPSRCDPTRDYVAVYDGHYVRSPLLSKFSCDYSDTLPITLTSSGSRLLVEFSSTGLPVRSTRVTSAENRIQSFAPSPSPSTEPDDGPNTAGKRSINNDVAVNQVAVPPKSPGLFAGFEVICGGSLTRDEGVIQSPGYPHEYRREQHCEWFITVPPEFQVAVVFEHFELERHDKCIYDYLELFDGHEADKSKSLARICGTTTLSEVKSTSNRMLVRFASDASVEKTGFSLRYMKEFNECQTTTHKCAHKCINTLGAYRCECEIGYELGPDGRSCEDACGGYIKIPNGTLTSPNFPHAYPKLKQCVWEIEAREQYRISLNFTHFDMEGSNQNCDYDYVEVSSIGADGSVTKSHGRHCGTKTEPLTLTSVTAQLRVEFRSDASVQKSGFAAIFSTDRDECEFNNGGCEQDCHNTLGSYYCSCQKGFDLAADGQHCKEGGCNFELDSPAGVISSPNHPENYPLEKDCYWHFITTPGHRLRVQFDSFDVEGNTHCTYDSVVLYDGGSTKARRLGTFCGTEADPVMSHGNQLMMQFHSDKSVSRPGFQAHYSSVCGGRLTADHPKGYIYSHATYGGQSYGSKVDCEWLIEARNGYAVEVRFTTFDVEKDPTCSYDFVEVYDGNDKRRGLIDKYCGQKVPMSIVSSGDALLVFFHTDDSINAKGFVAEYFLTEHREMATTEAYTGPTTTHPREPVVNNMERQTNGGGSRLHHRRRHRHRRNGG